MRAGIFCLPTTSLSQGNLWHLPRPDRLVLLWYLNPSWSLMIPVILVLVRWGSPVTPQRGNIKTCSPSEGLFEALVELLPVPQEAYVWASAPSPDTIHPIPPAVMHRRSCCGKRRKNLASEPSSLSLRQSALSQWLLMLVKQEGFQARAHNPVFFQEACVESVDSCPVPPSQHQQLHYVCTRELASHQEISVSICFPGDKTPGKVWAEEGNPSPWSTLEKTFSFPKPSPALLAAAAFRHQLNPISLLRFGHFR